jgi:hypothetical protein
LSDENDVSAQMSWRQVRAKLLARDGNLDEGERLSREAVALSQLHDSPTVRGDALRDLAEVLRMAGRHREEAAVLQDAIEQYERKGNTVSAARARDLLNRALAPEDAPPSPTVSIP